MSALRDPSTPCPPLALLVAESAQKFGIRVYEDRVQIQI